MSWICASSFNGRDCWSRLFLGFWVADSNSLWRKWARSLFESQTLAKNLAVKTTCRIWTIGSKIVWNTSTECLSLPIKLTKSYSISSRSEKPNRLESRLALTWTVRSMKIGRAKDGDSCALSLIWAASWSILQLKGISNTWRSLRSRRDGVKISQTAKMKSLSAHMVAWEVRNQAKNSKKRRSLRSMKWIKAAIWNCNSKMRMKEWSNKFSNKKQKITQNKIWILKDQSYPK